MSLDNSAEQEKDEANQEKSEKFLLIEIKGVGSMEDLLEKIGRILIKTTQHMISEEIIKRTTWHLGTRNDLTWDATVLVFGQIRKDLETIKKEIFRQQVVIGSTPLNFHRVNIRTEEKGRKILAP